MDRVIGICPTCGKETVTDGRPMQVKDLGAAIHGPDDVRNLLARGLVDAAQEHFVVLLLNNRHHVTAHKVVTIGTVSASLVHTREVFRLAIAENASAVLLMHNHPSGDPAPSREDIEITKKMIAAGEIIGIKVLDHVVVGKYGTLSLRQEGLVAF